MNLRVLAHSSVNLPSLGDIFEIDGEVKIVTGVSIRKCYIDGEPFDKKKIGKLKRDFIKQWRRGKSMVNNPEIKF